MKKFFKKIFLTLFIIILILVTTSFVANIISLNITNEAKKQIEIKDLNISYREYGKIGTPLLLIHDFLGSSNDFDLFAKKLSENGQKVLSLDLIGYGLSTKDSSLSYSIENLSKLCKDFMYKLGYEKFSVVGTSMGGEIALNMAYAYPNNIAKLILLNSSGYTKYTNISSSLSVLSPVFLSYPFEFFNYFNSFFNKNNISLKSFQYNFTNNLDIDNSIFKKMLLDNSSGKNIKLIKTINKPALIVWGRDDTVTPITDAFKIHDAIKNSELNIIENCGHMPYIEAKNLVANKILEFICN